MAEPAIKKKYDDGIEKALDLFIESAGKISANMLGMVNRVGGQIYALLFLTRDSLSLDEIAESLQVSKGNVSVNIRLLEEIKLVKKIWVKGSRRDYYEANRDYPRKLLKSFFDKIRDGIDESIRIINRSQTQFHGALNEIKEDENQTQDAKFMAQQLDILLLFYTAASKFFEDFYQGREVNIDLLRSIMLDE